jgi:hypothetical protein
MKISQGCLLSFNSFLSTSVKEDAASLYANSVRQDSNLTGIIFQMKINPTTSSALFTAVDKISYFLNAEEKIIFSMHTVFRIGELK